MDRFDELASGESGTIPGDETFKLYDTFGFPLDLTELMAAERGYSVDVDGFERALEAQRSRSRADRAASGVVLDDAADAEGWVELADGPQTFVGYDTLGADTVVLAVKRDGDVVGLVLRENPFYLESGGQVSDVGAVQGDGWRLDVGRVAGVDGRSALFGTVEGSFPPSLDAPLAVPRGRRAAFTLD
jgi:alanyl-tRNA synthetase